MWVIRSRHPDDGPLPRHGARPTGWWSGSSIGFRPTTPCGRCRTLVASPVPLTTVPRPSADWRPRRASSTSAKEGSAPVRPLGWRPRSSATPTPCGLAAATEFLSPRRKVLLQSIARSSRPRWATKVCSSFKARRGRARRRPRRRSSILIELPATRCLGRRWRAEPPKDCGMRQVWKRPEPWLHGRSNGSARRRKRRKWRRERSGPSGFCWWTRRACFRCKTCNRCYATPGSRAPRSC